MLDGLWEFRSDPEDIGNRDRWFRTDSGFSETITVPFPIGSPLSGQEYSSADVNWYRRVITPAELEQAGDGSRISIHFEAVDFEATVWVDGVKRAHHVGGYTPFTVVVDRPRSGRLLTITVRTEDSRTDLDKPRGKQDWRATPHGIWYEQSRGIWRNVWMEATEENYIESLNWSSDIDQALVTATVTLAQQPASLGTLTVELLLGDSILARGTAEVAERESKLILHVPALRNRHEWDSLLWAPGRPNLVDARVFYDELSSNDRVISYLGLRQVSLDSRFLRINRLPVFVRGILDQGYWEQSYFTPPSQDAIRRDLELAQEMGFNTVRIHERSADRAYLTWADRMGIMVWAESASAYGFSATAMERTLSEWISLVERDSSHPSIVVWVPFNESWGISSIEDLPEQRHFLDSVVSMTRALDSSRPVIANDGWEQGDTDIVTTHDYATTGLELEVTYESAEAVAEAINRTGPQGRKTLLDGDWHGDRPVMVTEFGGVSLNLNDAGAWGYGIVSDREALRDRLEELFSALYRSPILGGICYTQLTDTGTETNGLCDANRVPKIPSSEIRSIVCDDSPHRRHVRPRLISEIQATDIQEEDV
ncbi:glycoside hydrolase family 2 protein [Actinomyces minihominis]|uniref:glycoside hydrolase family 2 protein n=1 Tax=Actinomyces minihominis TaxID=2002838 RepID=UPI0013EAE318|nr:glycoside hydrolase family 2 TIM barrel-domain containing protein [Actinomyces minihominis]